MSMISPATVCFGWSRKSITWLCLVLAVMFPVLAWAREQKGRTAEELEKPYDWEHPDQSEPPVETTPIYSIPEKPHAVFTLIPEPTLTPEGSEDQGFYQRYFRKGKKWVDPTPAPTPKPLPFRTPTPEPDPLDREIRGLIHALGTEQHSRLAAVERLTTLGKPTLPYLRRALHQDYKFIRIGALDVLARLRDPQAVPEIQSLLKDPEPGVRAEAIKTLGRMKHRPSVARAAELLAADHDTRVRREAALALGKIGDLAANQALRQAWPHQPALVRQQIAQALSNFEGEATVQFLLNACQNRDEDRDTRIIAIRSLGEIGDLSAIPGLKKMVRDSDPHIRQEIAAALENLH